MRRQTKQILAVLVVVAVLVLVGGGFLVFVSSNV